MYQKTGLYICNIEQSPQAYKFLQTLCTALLAFSSLFLLTKFGFFDYCKDFAARLSLRCLGVLVNCKYLCPATPLLKAGHQGVLLVLCLNVCLPVYDVYVSGSKSVCPFFFFSSFATISYNAINTYFMYSFSHQGS